jgi:hypothetical protein
VDIYDLAIDDRNEDEFAAHRVTVREVKQVLDETPRVFRNGGTGNAPYVIVGPTYGGRLLTIPIDPTPVPTTWRPRTAYDASPRDRARYQS